MTRAVIRMCYDVCVGSAYVLLAGGRIGNRWIHSSVSVSPVTLEEVNVVRETLW